MTVTKALGLGVMATGLAVALLGAGLAAAAEMTPSEVRITDGTLATPLTDKPGDPQAGVKAYTDRSGGNCMTCHQNSDLPQVDWQGDIAPSLDGVADRYDEAQLRAIVVNSKSVFGEATFMPAMFRDSGFVRVGKQYEGQPIMTAQEVEDVVAYLLTLKQ